MTRNEHLQWAKDRAIHVFQDSSMISAWTAFVSDMKKHDDLNDHNALNMGTQMLFSDMFKSDKDFVNFIEGFN